MKRVLVSLMLLATVLSNAASGQTPKTATASKAKSKAPQALHKLKGAPYFNDPVHCPSDKGFKPCATIHGKVDLREEYPGKFNVKVHASWYTGPNGDVPTQDGMVLGEVGVLISPPLLEGRDQMIWKISYSFTNMTDLPCLASLRMDEFSGTDFQGHGAERKSDLHYIPPGEEATEDVVDHYWRGQQSGDTPFNAVVHCYDPPPHP